MQLPFGEGVLGGCASLRALGMIGMMFGLHGLTGKTERRNASRSTSTFREETGTRLNAAVEFTFDFLRAIEALKMLHTEVSKMCMVKKEFLLGNRKILIGISEHFHIEDFGEMVRRARCTRTVRSTCRPGRSGHGACNKIRDTVLCRNRNM
jgi:hypothetical protein